MATATHQQTAAELMRNAQFMKLFEKVLKDGAGDDSPGGILAGMPAEDDPKREAWLKSLQDRLQQESMRTAKEDLEQVHSDENGQWMFILPQPGFCIKCAVAGGGKVFINICQHERIAEPIPLPKEECEGMGEDEVRFRIPLSCGQARPDTDKSGKACKVYDVIVNPATLKRCTRDQEFRRFVAALCMQWIKQKSEPTMNADEFRSLNFKAKGRLEPQRIRLSAAAKKMNAMQDEIKLPTPRAAPTQPTQMGGAEGNGKLIQEIAPPAASAAVARTEAARVVMVADQAARGAVAATGTAEPSVMRVVKDGMYDWSAHAKPSLSPFFREPVPRSYLVEMHIPTVQTIREVDVRVTPKKLECFYVDEADDAEAGTTANPFLSVVFDYPVADAIEEAKFVRKSHILRLRFTVQLPDETAVPRTAPERDATEVEEEEARAAKEAREAAGAAQQMQRQRHESEEKRVLSERKGYVENLAAVQSGEIPPVVRDEVDAMPKEQMLVMLHRLEGRVQRGDSLDKLMETLPERVLDALIDYIRVKLSLQPRAPRSTSEEARGDPSATNASASTRESIIEEGESMRIEYNYAARSEKLFGVAYHNRYLFALDN